MKRALFPLVRRTKHPSDLGGMTFGMLRVSDLADFRDHGKVWNCVCECGKRIPIRGDALLSGKRKSCGCNPSKYKHRTHGMSKTPTYRVWSLMIHRCTNPSHAHDLASYGARGIGVCERWRDFSHFLKDMGERPAPNLTLERLDNNKGYEPGNVKWATRTEQQRNRRGNRLLTFDGRTQCVAAWAEETGVKQQVIRSRVLAGWPVERAITEPVHLKRSAKEIA